MDTILKNNSFSIKISYYVISKIFFAFYVIYTQALRYTRFFIPKMSFVFLVLTLLFYLLGTRRIYRDRYILCYLLFLGYAFFSGLVIVVGKAPFYMSIINLFEYFFSFYLIIVFSRNDKNIYYSMNVFVLLAIVMSFLNLIFGQGINRITFSENLNVNTIAIVMMFSIGFILYCLIQKKVNLKITIIAVICIVLFGYMILITVSKKAILGTGFLLVFWTLWCSGRDNSKGLSRKILIFVIVMFGIYYGFELFVKYMPTQYEYLLLRMSQLSEGTSTDKRRELINQGFNVFLHNPFFGVGLNNFRFYSSYNTYSHCFYSELFSCLGLFGALIFFMPFVSGVLTLVLKIKNSSDFLVKNRCRFLLAILLCLMLTSIAQIIFYEYELIYILGLLCSSKYIDDEDQD